MSRSLKPPWADSPSFPRVSGDEPAGRIPILLAHPFSPRERG